MSPLQVQYKLPNMASSITILVRKMKSSRL